MNRNVKKESICVYAIRCMKNGKIYIGSTSNLERRLKVHFNDLKSGNKRVYLKKQGYSPSAFQNDFDEFGIESFEVYVLEKDLFQGLRNEREEYWIDLYHTTDPDHGYNVRKQCSQPSLSHEVKYPVPVYIGLPPMINVGDGL